MDSNDVLIDQVTAAFQRLRTLLFTTTLFCAFLFGNAFVDHYSFDEYQIQLAPKLKVELQRELDELEKAAKQNPNDLKGAQDRSRTQARMSRIDNMLKDYKLRTVNIPIIGLTMPSNDVNIVMGLFLVAIAGWALFSASQIQYALTDPGPRAKLKAFFPALKHAAIFVRPPDAGGFISVLAIALLVLPPVTMAIVSIQDIVSIATYRHEEHLSGMLRVIVIRAIALTAIIAFLIYVSVQLLSIRKRLVATLSPKGE
jgi:hypothetical protein